MQLKEKFEAGEFAVVAEIDPPKGTDISSMEENAKKVKGKLDAFIVTEMSNAVMKMSALGGAMILQNRGLATVMQVCCRDRNRLALQADILAAAACGVKNLLIVKGDDPSFGDHNQAKAVYDIELHELLEAINELKQGRDMAGVDLAGTPDFTVGIHINAGATDEDLELEIEQMNDYLDAGVDFFITPPVFDLSAFEGFLSQVDHKAVKIIPTVLLLKSMGMARYMKRNMTHIYIPDELIQRIQKSSDKVRECTKIASEMVNTIKGEGFCGANISTIGWEHKLPEVLGLSVMPG